VTATDAFGNVGELLSDYGRSVKYFGRSASFPAGQPETIPPPD
jgi:hypothetical protein